MSAVATMLRDIRDRAGLSVEDAAHAAGVSPAWLHRVEAGEASMTHGMAGKLARALVDHLDGANR
ncbi:helix-turn-helix domain-containing protein [Brachybacterium alimentarium]|uniref:helix-turn-helix domain-containing protein n=1 Tax=Brachybacterium alimentarium TaxID=47845 RepID=UPI003FD47D3D